jgi:crotonobetainyl-CoA:carnitine CoA-transferase CaiB-like acyl-CoA transferase
MAPHAIYPASGTDNWIAIACRDDRDWGALRTVIGAQWAFGDRFAAVSGRMARQDELDALVADWTRGQDHHLLAGTLRAAGVPAEAVQRPGERIESDPATLDWGLWPTVFHTLMGEVRVDGIPIHFSATDWTISRGAPCLGEHNDVVFGDLLGHRAEEIEHWRGQGVL